MSPTPIAGNAPKCRVTSSVYSNESIAAYGIASRDPAYSNISEASTDKSNRPTTPEFSPGTEPPVYITCPSSTAKAGKQQIKTKQTARNLVTSAS